jgi:hypothetical protein
LAVPLIPGIHSTTFAGQSSPVSCPISGSKAHGRAELVAGCVHSSHHMGDLLRSLEGLGRLPREVMAGYEN